MPHPIRVLYVDHETRLSGGQQDLLDLVRALDHHEVDVHVALPGDGPLAGSLRGAGATVHVLPMSGRLRSFSRWTLVRRPDLALVHMGSFLAASLRLGRLISRLRPGVVHTNSMKAHLLAILPAATRRVPLVWHVRDVLETGWLRSVFAALGAAFPRRIVCLSQIAADQFKGSRAYRKVRVVYNGIRLDRSPTGAPEWRRRLGADGGTVLVGMVGQIARWKGQDVFVEAAARVGSRYPDSRFVVVGECMFPGNESRFAAEVERDARERLGDRIVWTGWIDEVLDLMAAFDVVVHASRLPEPFGRVLVEGMAAGTPVVASMAGAAPEIVPPQAGRLVAPGDAAGLARALDELVSDAEARQSCGNAARLAARRFDIRHTAEGVMRVYGEVLACA